MIKCTLAGDSIIIKSLALTKYFLYFVGGNPALLGGVTKRKPEKGRGRPYL